MYLCVCKENSQIGQVGSSHNEPCRERREGGGSECGQKKKGGGQRAREKDRVRVMETGSEPETRPQKSNYRSSREGVGPAPRHSFKQHKALPDSVLSTHTHKYTCLNLP